MSDLINREDAIKILKDLQQNHMQFCYVPFRQAIEMVQALPSADRPQGEWIRTFDGNEWYWYCSNCKEQWYEEDLWMGGNEFPYFCPNCGARMKGAIDGNK